MVTEVFNIQVNMAATVQEISPQSADYEKNGAEVSFYYFLQVQYTELKLVKSQTFHTQCTVREFKIHSFFCLSKAYLSEKAADGSN